MTNSLAWRSRKRTGRQRWLAVSAVIYNTVAFSGCTLENSVKDDPAGNAPPNAFRDAPAERSVALWSAPGENILAALSEVQENDRGKVLSEYNRVEGSFLGETGSYFAAMTAYSPFGAAFATESEQCENSDLPDAIEALCGAIADREPNPDDPEDDGTVQLVVINELPHAAFQRTLMRKLLPCAKELGFTHLAVEALEEDDAALEARGYVSRSSSGPFAREPQLAGLLEDGMRLGLDIVSYQVADRCTNCGILESINMHAEAQAANLVAKTFDVDPEAKVLVLAGARQAHKRMWGPGEPYTTSLGSHLWAQSGIEPYSVEQVAIDLPSLPFGVSSPNPPSGMYLASGPVNGQCMGSYTPDSPTGMGTLDAIVMHVPPRTDQARWDWLHAPADQRRTVTASCAACSANARLLLQAFPVGIERTDRVPTDQAVCDPGVACQMVLPAGMYELVVWSEEALVGSSDADLVGTDSAIVAL